MEMIKQMVKNNTGRLDPNFSKMMVETIFRSQKFLRKCDFEQSFVSLRDVDRLLQIFRFFEEKKVLLGGKLRESLKENNMNDNVLNLFLALGKLNVSCILKYNDFETFL